MVSWLTPSSAASERMLLIAANDRVTDLSNGVSSLPDTRLATQNRNCVMIAGREIGHGDPSRSAKFSHAAPTPLRLIVPR